MTSPHRLLLATILALNAVAFAGVDPITRTITAALVLVMAIDFRSMPTVPRLHRWALIALVPLVVLQLLPLPNALRAVLMPGCDGFLSPGWAPLSLAPWATFRVAASAAIVLVIALTAARMAATRSGLPLLLALIAGTGALIALLGLIGETGGAATVMLLRENTGGGGPYGPFVNRNHFAHAIELTLPALLVLLAASSRLLRRSSQNPERAIVMMLATVVGITICTAAMLRCASRGGVVFLVFACLASIPWWMRYRGGRHWPWVVLFVVVFSIAGFFAWTNVPVVEERMLELVTIEGANGNTRLEMWRSTGDLWRRAPLLGVGLGAYRHTIGLDKPATGAAVLEHAHNDWLEWAATAGLLGVIITALLLFGFLRDLVPSQVRRLRFEYRYPLAGLVAVLIATTLHEGIGFGLQTPLNRYLMAAWIGLFWGVTAKIGEHRSQRRTKSTG